MIIDTDDTELVNIRLAIVFRTDTVATDNTITDFVIAFISRGDAVDKLCVIFLTERTISVEALADAINVSSFAFALEIDAALAPVIARVVDTALRKADEVEPAALMNFDENRTITVELMLLAVIIFATTF